MGKRDRDVPASSSSCASTRARSMATCLASLPSTCLATVLTLLVGDLHAADAPLAPEPFDLLAWHRALAPFTLVSREWRVVTAQMTTRYTQSIARIDVTTAVVQTMTANTRGADVYRHVHARDLRLVMKNVVTAADTTAPIGAWFALPSEYDDAVPLRGSNRVLRSMGSLQIDWKLLLSPRAATLVRLDLSQVSLDCSQLGSVLLAASTSCPHVRVLALPQQSPRRVNEDSEARETNLNELYGALQRWHRTNGGLLHLRIPFGRFDANTAVRLLRSLVAYCPDIEYLDGWQDSYRVDAEGMASCEAYWPAPRQWWDALWRTCTKLREFNTVVMPFDDDYLGVFCPQVETLQFAINSANARHHEVTRPVFSSMWERMPMLQRLRLEIPFVRDDVWDPSECIDDVFVGTIAECCPKLREFRLQCADPRVRFDIGVVGVTTLAHVEGLEILELQQLRAFNTDMIVGWMYLNRLAQVALSFERGRDDAWSFVQRLNRVQYPLFFVSLWCIGIDSGEGVERSEVVASMREISEKNKGKFPGHVHATTNRSNSERLDFVHLEYGYRERNQQGHAVQQSTTPSFRFPVCGSECVGHVLSER